MAESREYPASPNPPNRKFSSIKHTHSKEELRMRVFAGPNGSGKSTVIESVRQLEVGGWLVDFGYYINADDIAKRLHSQSLPFSKYGVKVSDKEFREIAVESGLINKDFPKVEFLISYKLLKNRIYLNTPSAAERLAQIVADFLRKKLLAAGKKFSFETVFSHPKGKNTGHIRKKQKLLNGL